MLLPFFLALFMAIFRTAFIPTLSLMAFAPFLALLYQKRTFLPSLWIAFSCGLINDLMTSQRPFGLYALNFILTTLILYPQKRHFFEDRSLTLCLFTFFISSLSTLIQLILLVTVNQNPPLGWPLFFTDLFVLPLFDALYAAVWFIGPMKLYTYMRKQGLKKIFLREEE